MIRNLARRLAASLAFVLALPASASTFISPDFTDMWWNAAESGWGINISQQGSIVFATWYVYEADRKPKWYVASGMTRKDSPTGWLFEGKLYDTTGPWFGGPFNPVPQSAEVGTATLHFPSDSSATLTYNVGTTTVTKQVTRYHFQGVSPAGTYYPAGLTAVRSACSNSSANGPAYTFGVMRVGLNNSTVTFTVDIYQGNGAYCEFTGTLSPNGRFHSVSNGTWRCVVNGAATNQGNFTLSMLDIQQTHLTGTFAGNDAQCQWAGRFGGLRDVQ